MDEAGRGALFGRVYIACVVLPKDVEAFSGVDIKDSKLFSSKKKLLEKAEYIKANAGFWHIAWVDHAEIDKTNILKATMRGAHECCAHAVNVIGSDHFHQCLAVMDGNYFSPYCHYLNENESLVQLRHVTVVNGDATFMGIAAASILAKSARDAWIQELCASHVDLITHYSLNTNMGYGAKRHLDGIKEHGVTEWHRLSFGPCKKGVKGKKVKR